MATPSVGVGMIRFLFARTAHEPRTNREEITEEHGMHAKPTMNTRRGISRIDVLFGVGASAVLTCVAVTMPMRGGGGLD